MNSLRTILLCGGENLRLKGHFDLPKPLLKIKGKTVLTYIIEHYSFYGIKDFILLVGNNEHLYQEYVQTMPNVNIQVIQTGENTPTGGRLFQVKKLLQGEKTFFLTYGDGISNINIQSLLEYHQKFNKTATLTAVQPHLPYGLLNMGEDNEVHSFQEKPKMKEYINGGFFVLNPNVFDYLTENSDFETETLPKLAKNNELIAFRHHGFWKSLDTYKDYVYLENDIYRLNPNNNE